MPSKHEKTEKATPKRRQEARKKGQVARSMEFSGALVLGSGLIMVFLTGPAAVHAMGGQMSDIFQRIAHPASVVSAAGLKALLSEMLNTLVSVLVPICGVCMVVGLTSNIAQIGFRPSLKAITPDIKRINPLSGAKNLFGPRLAFETGKALAKVSVVGAVAALALIPDLTHLGANVGTSPSELGDLLSSGIKGICERVAAAYLVIATLDLIWQRRRHEKMLRMTKQEVKEESKQHALPPEVRAAVRRRQMQMARQRMMAAVPKADVVITNPTHYAVALAYDGSHPAPVLVAKGRGEVALQIRRIAEEAGVPLITDPPLARQIHADVEIDQMIPSDLYAAVAQVLAFVYRTAKRRSES